MENKKEFKISKLSKEFINSIANKVVLDASMNKSDSLSIGNFYQDFYELKINDLIYFVDENKKKIKSSKNVRANRLCQEAFDNLMRVASLRNEVDIVRNLNRANECINDALYLLDESKGGK